MLTSTTYVGSTLELLPYAPLGERGLCVGEDVFVAFSPDVSTPASPITSSCGLRGWWAP